MSRSKLSNEDIYPRLILENDKSSFNSSEDFCTICQKHFCNKYYLKKHKLDVHKALMLDSNDSNIPYNQNMLLNENLSQNHCYNLDINYIKHLFSQMTDRLRKETDINESNLFNLINRKETTIKPNQIDPSFPFQPDIQEPTIVKSKIHTEEVKFCSLNFSNFPISWHFCYQCNLRFPDELSLSSHSHNIHRIDNNHVNNISEAQRQFFQNIQMLSGQTTNHIDEFLSSNTLDAFKYSMAAAKLADRVTCDICGKDLCNKYFLRTHRKKVHGIKCDLMKSGIICRNISYPMERIDINTSKSNLTNHLEKKERSTADCKPNVWNQFEFSLDTDSTKIIKLESKYPVSSMPHSFTNKQYTFDSKKCKWIRKPLANKVKCDVCDRLICNKYFLKTHKYKKHGIKDEIPIIPANQTEFNKITSNCDCETNINNQLNCNSINTENSRLSNIINYLDFRNLDNREKKNTNSPYQNFSLTQKEEPLDLSLPKQSFPVHSDCKFYKNKISIRRKLMPLNSLKTINCYKRLISKYLGIRKLRFFCKT